MRNPAGLTTLVLLLAIGGSVRINAYPLDGYAETGIRRLEGARLASEGVIPGSKQPPGALLTTAQVDLRLLDHKDLAGAQSAG
jgi:hypothetical protein